MRTSLKYSGRCLIVSVAVATIVAATRAGAEEPLRWKFKVGEKLNYNMLQKMWMSASSPTGKKAQDAQITWNQFIKDFGPKAQKAIDAKSAQVFNEKYKDKTIAWTGRVKSVLAKPMGKGFEVVVNMDPTEAESAWANVALMAGDQLKTQANALKTGEIVKFEGRLVKPGRGSANHEVEATKLSPEQTMSTTMQQEMDMTWDVQGVDEASGEAVIRQKFDRVKMKMTTPVGGFEYDSKSEAAPTGLGAMIAPMYKAMTEGDFEITMTSRGEVKNVKIPEQVLTALKNSPGAATMGDIATSEGFKKMISQGALVLPKDPPKKGDSWSTKVEINNPAIGKQTVETTYRYDGTKDVKGTKYALIRPELKMEFDKKPQSDSQAGQPQQPAIMGLQMNIKDQSSDGEVLFNMKEGRLHSTTLKQNVTIEASAGGQSMEQRIDQRIDVEVTPASEKKSDQAEKAEASDAHAKEKAK